MSCHNPGCLGNYDFNHITRHARKRFIEGYSTISLLQQARSDREKEEISLVCMLDVEDNVVLDLGLSCEHAGECKVTSCRSKLKTMIENELSYSTALC